MSIYLGNTPVAGTGYDKADTDLSNLTSQGQNIANWSSNVTNCITEIPQDIKLELNNGTLTLKAGSKVYVPNGFEEDGTTPKFDVVTVESDMSITRAANIQETYIVDISRNLFYQWKNQFSGPSAPSGYKYMLWYDTTNNIVKTTGNSGSTWGSGNSFPVCLATSNATQITSIDQVFNGFGYIGSTVFALPGVKGLIPNGRNADGTLKNTEFTLDGVKIINNPDTDNKLQYLCWSSNNYFTRANWYHEQKEHPSWVDNNNNVWYNPETNKTYYYRTSNNQSFIPYIFTGLTFRGTDGSTKISEFNQSKTPFHALDYNDSSTISGWSMPSSRYIDLTLGASGATYIAPANGWLFLDKSTTGAQYITLQNQTAVPMRASSVYYAGGMYLSVYLPVSKGDIILITYNAAGSTNYFRFYYAQGEN